MKPKSAVCTHVYSNTNASEKSGHFVCFELNFNDDDMRSTLIVKTDKDHRQPIESRFSEFAQFDSRFEPWQKDSWQHALFMAWELDTSVRGYSSTFTNELVYELHERENGHFCYELTAESKEKIAPLLPRATWIDSDGTEMQGRVLPKEPIWLASQETTSFTSISMQVISGFMVALGVAAIAIAFSLLNAATLGTAGVAVAATGLVSLVAGCGLFKLSSSPQGSEHTLLPDIAPQCD